MWVELADGGSILWNSAVPCKEEMRSFTSALKCAPG